MRFIDLVSKAEENIDYEPILITDTYVSKFFNYYKDENGVEIRVFPKKDEVLYAEIRKEPITVFNFRAKEEISENGIVNYSKSRYRGTIETRHIKNFINTPSIDGFYARVKYATSISNKDYPENNIKKGDEIITFLELEYTTENKEIEMKIMVKNGINVLKL